MIQNFNFKHNLTTSGIDSIDNEQLKQHDKSEILNHYQNYLARNASNRNYLCTGTTNNFLTINIWKQIFSTYSLIEICLINFEIGRWILKRFPSKR